MRDRRLLLGIVGIAAIAVVAAAGVLYYKMSSRVEPTPGALGHPGSGNPPAAAAGNVVPSAAVPSIEAAAERLAQRLKANDGTGDDWALLARSYVQMHRYREAVDAYSKALEKIPGDPALLAEQAAARKSAGDAAPSK
jgi:cytochrome c-type biogenesis protein CcmH/NrfG